MVIAFNDIFMIAVCSYLDLLVEDLLLLLVEDMLLLGVLQESLILLGSIHFLALLTLLLKTQTWTRKYYIYIEREVILITLKEALDTQFWDFIKIKKMSPNFQNFGQLSLLSFFDLMTFLSRAFLLLQKKLF